MTDLRHNIPTEATPARVYAAIATECGLQGWWTRDTRMEAKAGGTAEFGFERREMVFRMRVDALDASRLVRMSCAGDHPEWAGTTLEWRIEPSDEGAVLHFEHRGWRETTDFCASCNTMWGNLMFRLRTLVETGSANPQWSE